MKRSYKIEDLECANCAAKMEGDINKIDCVKDCKISFMTGKMTIDATTDDMDAVLDEAQRICSSYEKDCTIVR